VSESTLRLIIGGAILLAIILITLAAVGEI
jgi:hypothetical protein